MSKVCPVTKTRVVYLDCLDCDDKICRNLLADTNKENKECEKGDEEN